MPRRGFTLIEVMIATAVGGIAVAVLVTLFVSINRNFAPVALSYGTYQGQPDNYNLAPDQTAFSDAVVFHSRLKAALDGRSHFFVYGGTGQVNTAGRTTLYGPVKLNWLPADLSAGGYATSVANLGTGMFSPYNNLTGGVTIPSVAGNIDAASSASDFTVIVMQGVTAISAIAQVRCYAGTDGNNYYMAQLTDGAGLNRVTRYKVAVPAALDNPALPVGATTYWEGVSDGACRRFTTPVYRLVFPDPGMTYNTTGVQPYSTFIYFNHAVR